ncbi:MAG: SapC family protein [Rickettsiales bacterium]|nr:SapC family protein [Rickettsiales bacterium]
MTKAGLKPKPLTDNDDAKEAPLPLFFNKPHALDAERHRHAGLEQAPDASFAANSNMVPVHQFEFAEVLRNYPIAIINEDRPTPVAVLGLGQSNDMVNAQGQWRKGCYIPAYVRKYPFALIQVNQEGKYALCVDEGADNFVENGAELPFYDVQGDPAEVTQKALEFCGQFQKCMDATIVYCQALKDEGLLQPKEIKIETPSGKEFVIAGTQHINEEKWRALDDKTYLEWRKNGWVDLTHMLLLSQMNWKYISNAADAK